MQPKIKAAPTVVNATAQGRHCIDIGDVHRGQRRTAATGLDPVIQLFESTSGFGHCNDVMRVAKRFGQSGTKAAGRAGDKSCFCHEVALPEPLPPVKRGAASQRHGANTGAT